MAIPTPDEKRVQALETVATAARLLLDRLRAMEESGVLSPVTKAALDDWAGRLALALAKAPPIVPDETSES